MNHVASRTLFISAIALSFVTASVARGDDAASMAQYNEAKAHFAKRESTAEVDAGIQLLAQAVATASNDDIKYDMLILKSHLEFWKGVHLTGEDERIAQFEAGMKSADDAKAINADYAEAYFMHGLNLARWGSTKGKLKALFRLSELIKCFEDTMDREDRNGQPGEAYDSYGSDRILGRIYFELPWPTGDNKKSLKFLEKSFAGAPNRVLNHVYYAETLAEVGQKDKARQVLDAILAKDAATLDADKVQENTEEMADAKALRAKL